MRFAYCLIAALAAVMVLSLSGFAQNQPVNVANPGFEEGSKGWELPPNYSVDNTVAHSGGSSLKIVSTDPEVYQLAAQSLKFEPETMYKFSVWVKTQGVAGKDTGATICVEYWDEKGGYLGGSYPAGILGDNDWKLVEGDVSQMPPKTAKVNLTVYLRKGMTGTAWFDDIQIVPFYGEPFDCALIEPVYRGTMTEGSKNQNITVFSRVAQKFEGGYKVDRVRIKCSVVDGDKVLLVKSIKPVAGLNKITMNGSRLPVGKYKVISELVGPGNQVIKSMDLDFEKQSASVARPTVYIDEFGRTIRNGKPYFPFGFYFGPNPSKKGEYKEHIDRISDSPFNTIMPYGINVEDLETIREYLDYLDSKDVTILYSLKDILKDIAYYQENMLGLGDEKGQITGIVNAFKDHPAVLAWYLNDEAPIKYQDRLKERYKMVKSLDPNHPTWSVLCDPGTLSFYLETCDVLGTDPYPMNKRAITQVSDWTKATFDVGGGKRCIWQVPQVMDWNCYNYDKEFRAPTLDEMIVMSYLALIEGARGLVYYSYFDLQRDTRGFDYRWKDVMLMGKEVEKLIPAAMSLNKPAKVKVEADPEFIRYAAKADDNNDTFLMLANVHLTRAYVARISVPKGKKIEMLRHAEITDVTSQVKDGKLTVSIPGTQAATIIVRN